MEKKKRAGIIVFVIGMVALVAGAVFLILNLVQKPGVRDAEYLVEMGTWQEQDAESVVWQFTEIGKGKLTTNNHTNDYDFIWAIDGDKLKIETNWEYKLENEYTYELDQAGHTLKLTTPEKQIIFTAKQSN